MRSERHLPAKLTEVVVLSVLKRRTDSSGGQRRESVQRAASVVCNAWRRAGARMHLFGAVRKEVVRVGSIPGRMAEWRGSLGGWWGGKVLREEV